MPKATINKHGNALFRKNEIRFPEKRVFSSPTGYAISFKKSKNF